MSKRTAAELFGSDVAALAILLHLAERAKELNEGSFKAGWESAIEEAGAYIDSMAKDGRDTMQTLMEQVVGLMNGSYVLMETPQRPLGIVQSRSAAPVQRSVAERAWEFTQGAFKSFDLPEDRLREYSALIAELIQGAVDEARRR